MSTALIQRWDTFLGKIRSSLQSLFAQAEQGCLTLLDLSALDPLAMTNAWTGIRAEAQALSRRIDDVWQEKVEPTCRAGGMSEAEIERQRNRGDEVRDWVDRQTEEREIEIFAAAGERILAAARAKAAQEVHCTQCGALVEVGQHLFRSVHVTCRFCGCVNTYEPGMLVRQVEHFCAHHLGQKSALSQWHALKDAEAARCRERGASLVVLQALEAASRRYWEAYFSARAELVPAFAADVPRDVEGRMRAFYDDMQHEPVWVEHMRSRSGRSPPSHRSC